MAPSAGRAKGAEKHYSRKMKKLRRTLRLAVAALGLAGTAQAHPLWKGAAWYEVSAGAILQGPFVPFEECEQLLPPDLTSRPGAKIACEYMEGDPDIALTPD